jgi:imidazoleglycerol phosphate dehydratase HisB
MEKSINTNPSTVVASNSDVSDSIDDGQWKYELDLMGRQVSAAQLQAHLDKAPDIKSADAQHLMEYLARHAKNSDT